MQYNTIQYNTIQYNTILDYTNNWIITAGGASLGFYHAGVVKALLNEGLLPRVIRSGMIAVV